MGKFTPGTGGRPKGSPNKATGDLREWINTFVEGNRDQLEKDWKKLSPKDRLILFEKLLKYVVPVLQSTTITPESKPLTRQIMIINGMEIEF